MSGGSASSEPVRATLVIRGHVQGVWYRASSQVEAARLGLAGWVRNEPDGSVRAVVEGPRAAVESLVAWCREGPPKARVDAVDVEWAEASGEWATFEVLPGA